MPMVIMSDQKRPWVIMNDHGSARNKDQKLVGCFLKIGYFTGYYTAVPLKMYGKFGQSK